MLNTAVAVASGRKEPSRLVLTLIIGFCTNLRASERNLTVSWEIRGRFSTKLDPYGLIHAQANHATEDFSVKEPRATIRLIFRRNCHSKPLDEIQKSMKCRNRFLRIWFSDIPFSMITDVFLPEESP